MAPGVLDPGEPVLDLMLAADTVKDVLKGVDMPVMIAELDAIIGEHDVEPVGPAAIRLRKRAAAAIFCDHFPGLLVQFNESELRGAVDGDEEIQFAFSGLNLSDINVKVVDRIGLELPLRELVALDLGQSADVVPLQAAVQ